MMTTVSPAKWYQLLLTDFGEKAEPQPLFHEYFAIVLCSELVIFRWNVADVEIVIVHLPLFSIVYHALYHIPYNDEVHLYHELLLHPDCHVQYSMLQLHQQRRNLNLHLFHLRSSLYCHVFMIIFSIHFYRS